MKTPYFSVLLFTKNRSDVAKFALLSVLRQSFPDFEVVVSDNDDTEATQEVLSQIGDPRIRYYRSGGGLSMVDNWEKAFSLAKGDYVLSLTDRAVLKSRALEQIAEAIEHHGEDAYVWPYVLHDSRGEVDSLAIPVSKPTEVRSSTDVFSLFCTKAFFGYTDFLPKSLNSCHSRKILERIRQTTGGPICLPLTPDHNLAFLTLAHCERLVLLNEPLFVWGGLQLSTGGAAYRGGDAFKRFLAELKITEADLFAKVPVKTVGIHNVICNDFLRLKSRFPERFQSFNLDWPHYFVSCHEEPAVWLSCDDPIYKEKMIRVEEALLLQPISIQREVERILAGRHQRRRDSRSRVHMKARRVLSRVRSILGALARTAFPREISRPAKFANIMEALEWVERSDGT